MVLIYMLNSNPLFYSMVFLLQEGVSLDYSKVQFKTTMFKSQKREIEKPFSSTMQEKLKLITRKVELK